MGHLRPWYETTLIVGKSKDQTGRTPVTEYRRTGENTEVFHGHLLDSDEDREAIKRVNASVEEAHRAERPGVI